jgi:hypothetical protein
LALNGIHGVIPQKIEIFITTAVKTSNPTKPYIFFSFINKSNEIVNPPTCLILYSGSRISSGEDYANIVHEDV